MAVSLWRKGAYLEVRVLAASLPAGLGLTAGMRGGRGQWGVPEGSDPHRAGWAQPDQGGRSFTGGLQLVSQDRLVVSSEGVPEDCGGGSRSWRVAQAASSAGHISTDNPLPRPFAFCPFKSATFLQTKVEEQGCKTAHDPRPAGFG